MFAATLNIARGADRNVEMERITKNPGLLPIRLGTTQNIIDHWQLIQIYDLSSLNIEFNKLVDNYYNLNSSFYKSAYGIGYAKEMFTYRYLLEYKFSQFKSKYEQMTISRSKDKRPTRGLINGLGSIWKSISGNLDQSDADRYDSAILQIKTKQEQIKTIVEQQLSITDKALHAFNESMSKLQHNQILLEKRINQIASVMENITATYFNEIDSFVMLNTIFNQLLSATEILIEIIDNAENSITFAKLNSLHPSIITHQELKIELSNIKSNLKNSKLPFELDQEDLVNNYYSIINIKGYIRKEQIVFILEIPLVELKMYDYYKLYSLPVFQNTFYQIVIPKSPFLMINNEQYGLINEQCKEVYPTNYLCNNEVIESISNNNPCEVNLINLSADYKNCEVLHSYLTKTKIQKVTKNKWLIITVNATMASIDCNNVIEKSILDGIYVVTVPKGCKLTIAKTILNSFENSNPLVKHFNLPSIELPKGNTYNQPYMHVNPLHLDDVNLNELKNLDLQLKITKQQISNIKTVPFHYNNISLYTIIMYVIIIIVMLCVIKKYYPCLRKKIVEVQNIKTRNPLEDVSLKN